VKGLKCKLDADEPKLSIMGSFPKASIREGLRKLRDKVANDHTLSTWYKYQFRGYGNYANQVWEWDFKPPGDRSSTRPGWRVFAFVPHPEGPEPILARPFLCWDKSKAPKGNEIPVIIEALKKFLSEHVTIELEEEVFKKVVDGDCHVACCQLCFETLKAANAEDLEVLMDTHKPDCPRKPPW
jgi:hypothetical protein